MARSANNHLAWWRRIGFRLGVVVVVCVLAGEVLAMPLFAWMDSVFYGGEAPSWYTDWSLFEFSFYFGIILLMGVVVGSALGLVASHLFARRLRDMAAIASLAPGEDEALPGPYPVTGGDEITRLAQALNHSRERASELIERLAERDARRSEWVAQVSHDLRTPLAALRTCLEHAEVRLARGSLEAGELERMLSVASEDALRVSNLATDLLEIARLETEPTLRREAVLPLEIAESTLRLLEPLAEERHIRVELESDGQLPELEADGRLICRALENLVINSLEHAQSRVQVKVSRARDGVRFAVRDDGQGLGAEGLGAEGLDAEGQDGRGDELSFADLRRVRSRADSAGIGLMVTQRVASIHGGRTGVSKCEGGGAEVWFEVVC